MAKRSVRITVAMDGVAIIDEQELVQKRDIRNPTHREYVLPQGKVSGPGSWETSVKVDMGHDASGPGGREELFIPKWVVVKVGEPTKDGVVLLLDKGKLTAIRGDKPGQEVWFSGLTPYEGIQFEISITITK